jgi:2,3-bisphosphoglycerate-dependent phosphoglycerate mutase
MQFYFIRHGQSENNQIWAETGSLDGRSEDPDLTSLGLEQAERLARFLSQPGGPMPAQDYDPQNVAGFGLTHLYCSLMIRSVATGTIVAHALDLPLVAWVDAHEVGGMHRAGEQPDERIGLPGKNRAYFEAHYPDLVLPATLGDEGWWNRPYEARDQRPLRAQRFWNDLLERHGDTHDHVAVISHGGFYYYLMRAIYHLPDEPEVWFSLNNTAISRIDLEDERIVLQYLNRADFLPREMIT